ncbi:unnamed protein product [Polarella glacialis]|uniref:SET domain-containing protein n=1 Tax=Polarella glacialis TaxID=89957 RepID=A0A813HJM7_POLGL|nr:unnamed protein product [Polarella glacialis]
MDGSAEQVGPSDGPGEETRPEQGDETKEDKGIVSGDSKAEKNRQKREKKKALQAAPFFCLKAERKDAGPGRGQGLFASEAIKKGETLVCVSPAISVIFDAAATQVCSFCFRHLRASAATRKVLLKRGPTGGFGILIDGDIVTGFADGSPNAERLTVGDVLAAIGGEPVGDVSAVSLIKKTSGDTLEISLAPLRQCHRCGRLACCLSCAETGCLSWHSHECEELMRMSPEERKGDTSVLRMLLRYKALQERGDWCGPSPAGKEALSLLPTLQATSTSIPAQLLSKLSKSTGVDAETCSRIIFQIRTNAAEIHRGRKVGCALSVYVGYANHDCDANAGASVDADGHACITATRSLEQGEEVLISYVDRHAPFRERQKILREHYGFYCRCKRCVAEEREGLEQNA